MGSDQLKIGVEDTARKNYFTLFPNDETLNQSLPEAFIVNIPMSTVGGDGYWLHRKFDHIYLVAFDCMGHGHLASMITRKYTEIIAKVVVDEQVEDPGEILIRIHNDIRSRFGDKMNRPDTGADVGVVKINIPERKLWFAGAKMDLAQVIEGEMKTIKANRLQVGEMFEEPRKYDTYRMDLNEERPSKFYLQSDGLRDLFGGPDGKKLGKSNMFKLLEENYPYPFKVQKERILAFIEEWNGSNMQLDDILLIGFSV